MTSLPTTHSIAYPPIPAAVRRLPDLAKNLWWSWTPLARELFEHLDPTLWRLTHHNPVRELQMIDPERLAALSRDAVFLRLYTATVKAFDRYMAATDHWFGRTYPSLRDHQIAYFSAEFGLHNSLPLYSGGLGILAGDHLKEASDLGVPMVGLGFMYSQAYFRQVVNAEGWQIAVYDPFDREASPIEPALTSSGAQVTIRVRIADRYVTCAVWRVAVGRVMLYLLDSDMPENGPADRELSARLYGGDLHTRLSQEILLGIGGVRALRAVGVSPVVWHANEGHPAFQTLERIREGVIQGLSPAQAIDLVRHTTVFTSHTPVPAGHDIFPAGMIREYLQGYWDELQMSFEEFLALGRHPGYSADHFHMTVLGINLAVFVNGVSHVHGNVTRSMFRSLWPGRTEDEIPIHVVTNGIHVPTWIAPEMHRLYSKYLGPNWIAHCDDQARWQRVLDIPDAELWETRQFLKRKLLNFIRRRIGLGWMHGDLSAEQVIAQGALLRSYPLTIGFARRFATYKRATLLFTDLERLRRLLLDPWKPVQIVFAGKAHPADEHGRALIHEVYRFAKDRGFGGHIAFIEDYDMHLAKFLVQGVDLWLNNPRAPLEASGTSGQKASLNGVPNVSVIDGWWAEGYDGTNGWAIASSPGLDPEQDRHDAEALYGLLEQEIVPLYYDRAHDGVPHGWVRIIKNAIRTIAPTFSARRMLKDYVTNAYEPIMSRVSLPMKHQSIGQVTG